MRYFEVKITSNECLMIKTLKEKVVKGESGNFKSRQLSSKKSYEQIEPKRIISPFSMIYLGF